MENNEREKEITLKNKQFDEMIDISSKSSEEQLEYLSEKLTDLDKQNNANLVLKKTLKDEIK